MRLHAEHEHTIWYLNSFLHSSDWLMHLKLGYFACSLISILNSCAATLKEESERMKASRSSQGFIQDWARNPLKPLGKIFINVWRHKKLWRRRALTKPALLGHSCPTVSRQSQLHLSDLGLLPISQDLGRILVKKSIFICSHFKRMSLCSFYSRRKSSKKMIKWVKTELVSLVNAKVKEWIRYKRSFGRTTDDTFEPQASLEKLLSHGMLTAMLT